MHTWFSLAAKILSNNEEFANELELLRLKKKRRLKGINNFNKNINLLKLLMNDSEYFSNKDLLIDNSSSEHFAKDTESKIEIDS